MKMKHLQLLPVGLLLLWVTTLQAQQLKLGNNPTTINKSALLEMESLQQGLLLPRIPDTTVAPLTTAPDGMLIFFTADSTLRLRKAGAWQKVTDVSTGAWVLGGNSPGSEKTLGTTTNYALPIITNNTERMRIGTDGRVGIGVTTPSYPLTVRDTLEIRHTLSSTAVSTLLFSNTAGAGSGDFRIGSDGWDVFWQGGGGHNLQMGSWWGMILYGDRGVAGFPAFGATSLNTGVLIPAQRTASVALGVQAIAGQTVNLTEWRSSAGTAISAVAKDGSLGVLTAAPTAKLDVAGTFKLGASGTILTNVIKGSASITDIVTAISGNSPLSKTITITGATTTASVIVNPRAAMPAGVMIAYAYVSAANTVTVVFGNTGASQTLGTVTLDVTVIQ
jgi:hypothetical protein